MGNDLTRGTTYVDGGVINALNLNAHVDDGIIKPTAISSKTAKTTLDPTDEFLINDAGTLKKTTGAQVQWPGTVVQTAIGTYAASADLTVIIPADDTVPLSTEGVQVISLVFTPRFTTSLVLASFHGFGAMTAAGTVIATLFRGTTCLQAAAAFSSTANASVNLGFEYSDASGVATAVTYSIRVGPNVAGTVRLNGGGAARLFGGAAQATLTLREIKQ